VEAPARRRLPDGRGNLRRDDVFLPVSRHPAGRQLSVRGAGAAATVARASLRGCEGHPALFCEHEAQVLTLLLKQLEYAAAGSTARPQSSGTACSPSRRVPAKARREVWSRDGGQCTFVGSEGRCTERGFLQYHHVVPYAGGGRTCSDNLTLRCAGHNRYEAVDAGELVHAAHRELQNLPTKPARRRGGLYLQRFTKGWSAIITLTAAAAVPILH